MSESHLHVTCPLRRSQRGTGGQTCRRRSPPEPSTAPWQKRSQAAKVSPACPARAPHSPREPRVSAMPPLPASPVQNTPRPLSALPAPLLLEGGFEHHLPGQSCLAFLGHPAAHGWSRHAPTAPCPSPRHPVLALMTSCSGCRHQPPWRSTSSLAGMSLSLLTRPATFTVAGASAPRTV